MVQITSTDFSSLLQIIINNDFTGSNALSYLHPSIHVRQRSHHPIHYQLGPYFSKFSTNVSELYKHEYQREQLEQIIHDQHLVDKYIPKSGIK